MKSLDQIRAASTCESTRTSTAGTPPTSSTRGGSESARPSSPLPACATSRRAKRIGGPVAERPTLFSGAMVRGLLDGTKTQTRRLVMPMRGLQSTWLTLDGITASPRLSMALDGIAAGAPIGAQMEHPKGGPLGWVQCPYYQRDGDRLWVRETHALHHAWDERKAPAKRGSCKLWYRADADPSVIDGRGRWRPSIFTTRWMSRITLHVASVRVERLRDITEADAWAEGVAQLGRVTDARGAYFALWDSLNADRAPVESNPWVWVVSWKEAEVRRAA